MSLNFANCYFRGKDISRHLKLIIIPQSLCELWIPQSILIVTIVDKIRLQLHIVSSYNPLAHILHQGLLKGNLFDFMHLISEYYGQEIYMFIQQAYENLIQSKIIQIRRIQQGFYWDDLFVRWT